MPRFALSLLFLFSIFFILEGPPQFGMTPDSVTIGDHASVNDSDGYSDNKIWRFHSQNRIRL